MNDYQYFIDLANQAAQSKQAAMYNSLVAAINGDYINASRHKNHADRAEETMKWAKEQAQNIRMEQGL